jgi:hydrogenase maturation factor HypE
VSTALTVGQGQPAAQVSGVVLALGFDEPTGLTVNDASGNGNVGTISGATRTSSGLYGGALTFDGIDDSVTINSSSSLVLTGPLTIEAWVFPTRAGDWQTAVMKEAPNDLRYALYASSDNGRPSGYLKIGGDRSVYGAGALPLGVWSHVALTYDGATMRLYVNGVQSGTRAQTGGIATSTGALRIGGNTSWGEYFQGTLDEIRVYNRALSANEITSDLNTPITPQVAKLVITAPAPNATIAGPAVNVAYTTSGPLSGEEDHVHFLLDGATVMDPPPMDGVYQFPDVAAGSHVLGGYLARANHSKVPGTDATAVTFAVVGPDIIAPTVAGTSPLDGAVGVPATAGVWAAFSEAVNPATVNSGTVLLFSSAQSVAAAVTYDATNLRAVLTPSAALEAGATYTAVVKGGTAGVTDLSGNPIASDFSWSFRTAAAAPPPPPPPPVPPGLVAAYGFNEGSGTVLNDASGNGNNGTISGATWTGTGRYGGALTFNGINNTVTIPDAPSLDLSTGMTVEAWVYPTALSGYRTVVLKEVPGELAYCLYAHDNAPRPAAYINTGAGADPTVAGTAALPLNVWTHLAVTYDGAQLKLFVGGVQVAARATTGALLQSANALRIGGNAVWGEYFQGRLDEIRVYNRALTLAEIQVDRDTAIGSAPPPASDTIPPTVMLTAPTGGTVSGITTLTANASDNVAVSAVQFRVDGGNVGSPDPAAPYTVTWDTTTVSSGPHSITAVASDAAGNVTTSAAVPVTVANSTDPAQIGAWSEPVELGMVAVHMTLLHTGKLLMWRGMNMGGAVAVVWDYATNTMRSVPNSMTNLFCAGHSRLADGRILVAGGHDTENNILGTADANIFDPVSESWQAVPKMAQRRWYPTATTLADGRVLVTSGGTTCFTCIADIPEVYDPITNRWTSLTAARLSFPYYPFTFVLPDGRVLNAGAGENPVATRILDVAAQTWTTVDANAVDGGSAVMYRIGKVLKTGTAVTTDVSNVPAASTAYVLDMSAPSPGWRQVSSMAYPRAYHNSTVLPDGTVLITGGGFRTEGKNNAYAVYDAELWSPSTETFRTVARMQTPRQYHGTALLLPDGRVLVAGSGDSYGGPDQTVAEFYSPPYLFKGARPSISSAPSEVQYGTPLSVTSAEAASVTSVTLIRLGSVTHQFDEDQRYLELNFTRNGDTLTIQAPASANLAPPGHYMLFLVNASGVPSIAAIVRFPSPAEDHESPSSPVLSGTASISRADLTWSASSDNTGVSRYDVHRSSTSGFLPTAANRIGQVAGTTYTDTGLTPGYRYYRVVAADVAGNVSAPSNEAAVLILSDTTAPSVAITAPLNGTTVSGVRQVQASASDDGTVAGVRFQLDGVDIGSEDTIAPYAVSWNTTTTQNGEHTLSAVVRDTAGNTAESAAVVVSVSNSQAASGLIAAYSFDQGTGSLAPDATGLGHTGTITGATWTSGGRFGGALVFNGSSAQVAVADTPDLDLTTGMTLEAWVRPTGLSGWRTVIMKEASNTLAYTLYAHDQAPRPAGYIRVGGADRSAAGTAALALNTWTHIAATYDGAALRLYVNGTQAGSVNVTGSISMSDGALRIGGNAIWGEYFQGSIDEVRIYNRALSAGEIQIDMATPVGG